MAPSRRSLRGLDWFVFFLADVQTGFGAFVSVYLTAEKWTQTDIGFVLTVGAVVGLAFAVAGEDDPGAAHQDVEPSEPLDSARDSLLYGDAVGDIEFTDV